MISKKNKKKYLSHPFACPFCESSDITAGDREADGCEMTQRVECDNPGCGKSWLEIYRLAEITE